MAKAKIDFTAMKNARKAIEDKVEENIPEELEKSYAEVWGREKESVIQVEVTRLIPFSDESGNVQPFKINKKRVYTLYINYLANFFSCSNIAVTEISKVSPL